MSIGSFFKFLSIMESLFNASKPKLEELIDVDSSGLTLKLKQGKALKVEGEYRTNDREMNVLLSYNSHLDTMRAISQGEVGV